MNSYEQKIYKDLQHNSFIFFKDFIDRLIIKDNPTEDLISEELVILSLSSLQISLELALKAVVLKKSGLLSLIAPSGPSKSFKKLYNDFQNNSLKAKQFEQLKIFTKKNKLVSNLTDDDFEIITNFQRYRNGVVHFSFKFQEGDYFDLKYDITYFVVNILIKVLCSGDENIKPSEFLQYNLGAEYHSKLIGYSPYVKAMEKMSSKNSYNVFYCISCNNKTYSKDEDYCYCCNYYGNPEHFRNCEFCKTKNSMIYDGLNLELNNYSTKALCLNCHRDTYIFMCPGCEMTYNLEFFDGKEKCSLDNCLNR